jgi:hypothetical protein
MNKERRKEIALAIKLLNEIVPKLEMVKDAIGKAAEEEREFYDNMNENLQGSDKGQQADSAASLLEEVHDELSSCDLEDWVSKLEEADC